MSITEAEMRRLVTGVKTKNLDELDAVMDNRIATNSPDPLKRNIHYFIVACTLGNRHVVSTYLALRRFDEEALYSGLVAAVFVDAVDVVKVLIEDVGLDPNSNKRSPLLSGAALHGASDVLKYLISLPVINVNHTYETELEINHTALYDAVIAGKPDAIKILLEAGANPYIPIIMVRKPVSTDDYNKASYVAGFRVTPENFEKLSLDKRSICAYDEIKDIAQSDGESSEVYKVFKAWEAKVGKNVVEKLQREAKAYSVSSNNNNVARFPKNASPAVIAKPGLAVPKFSSVDFNGASAFMSRYKDSLVDASLKQLHPLVTASMEGESFLSIVTCYLIKREFDLAVLYQAIYLAAWFDSEKSIETIIHKCHTDLDADLMIKVLEQGRADSERYKGQVANTRKNKTAQQIDAVAQMKRQLSLMLGEGLGKHENSSDEERLSPPGSNSPGHSSDSDKEPQSAGSDGSNNSPPPSPPKLPVPPAAQQFVIPPGNEPLDHVFLATRNRKERFALYDTGRVTLNCRCDKCHVNALQECRTGHDIDLVKHMLYHPHFPASINSVNNRGRTILHLEVDSAYSTGGRIEDIIRKFSDKNPNINAVDDDGNTPLHLACTKEYEYVGEVVAELLKGGANPNIRNKQGLTAIQYAEANCKNPERKRAILEAFKQAGIGQQQNQQRVMNSALASAKDTRPTPSVSASPQPIDPIFTSLRPAPASNYDDLRRQADNKKASKNSSNSHVTQEEKEKCCVM